MTSENSGDSTRVPKVTVIMPTYNGASTIARAIDSALGQSYDNIEIVVIDDGSTDDTRSILQSYIDGGQIIYLTQDQSGTPAARNRGIDATDGPYIALLDSDDEWLPDKIEKQIGIMLQDPEGPGVVYSDMVRVTKNGVERPFPSPEVTPNVLFVPDRIDYQAVHIGSSSIMFRRGDLVRAGAFDEGIAALCDVDLLLRLIMIVPFRRIGEPLVKYYASSGLSVNFKAQVQARERLIQKYQTALSAEPRRLSHQYWKVSINCFLAGQHRKARDYAIRSVKLDPLNPVLLLKILVVFCNLRFIVRIYQRLLRIG